MGWDEEFGMRLEETENKAQVPQVYHPAKVLDFRSNSGLEMGLQIGSVPGRLQFLGRGAELLCVCTGGGQEEWERYNSYFHSYR